MRAFAVLTILIAIAVGWLSGGAIQRTLSPAPRIAAVAAPRADSPPGSVEVLRGHGGHFTVDGSVNGTALRFVVDTGSSAVALGRSDAARAGIAAADADFDSVARTVGGTIRVAHVRIGLLRVGSIEEADVPAVILDVPAAIPLLGQSFLDRIDRVSIEGNRLTLTKLGRNRTSSVAPRAPT